MSVLKCKMCGGNLAINEGEEFAICESCGTQQTYPRFDSDELARRRDSATIERIAGNFDNAFNIYNELAIKDPENSEAHWETMLCRYGINYQKDPRTGRQVPTINRTRRESVFDDSDYIKAIEYAEPSYRTYYEDEGAKIEAIRSRYVRIIDSKDPFDVFICFKETDDSTGRRTEDSAYGQELYNYLAKEGYKVFFSRVTLNDMAGEEFEPNIFAALNSAKLMFVIGTNNQYLNSPWVKNEWSRFLALIDEDFDRQLVPLFKGTPDYFPAEIRSKQGYNLAQPGWYQDCLGLVEKYVKKNNPVESQIGSAGMGIRTLDNVLTNAEANIQARNWDRALEYFVETSENYANDYRGWWGCVRAITKEFTDEFAYDNNRDRIQGWIRSAITFANDKQKNDIMTTIQEFLKKVSEIDTSEEISTIESRIGDYRVAIDNKNNEIEAIENQMEILENNRDNNIGAPIHEINESIEKQKAEKNEIKKWPGILMIIASVFFALLTISLVQTGGAGTVLQVILVIGFAVIAGFGMGSFIAGAIGAAIGYGIGTVCINYPIIGNVVIVVATAAFVISTIRKNIKTFKGRAEHDKIISNIVGGTDAAMSEWIDGMNAQIDSLKESIESNKGDISWYEEVINKLQSFQNCQEDISKHFHRQECAVFDIDIPLDESFEQYYLEIKEL